MTGLPYDFLPLTTINNGGPLLDRACNVLGKEAEAALRLGAKVCLKMPIKRTKIAAPEKYRIEIAVEGWPPVLLYKNLWRGDVWKVRVAAAHLGWDAEDLLYEAYADEIAFGPSTRRSR